MTTAPELHWRPSFSCSCLHAAKALLDGKPLADARLAAALDGPARELQRQMDVAGLPSAALWRHLIPLSASIESNRELAETALVKVVGRNGRLDLLTAGIAQAIAALEAAMHTHLPRLAEELPLRVGPLREQWEARGPGLLRRMVQQTEEDLLPPRAEVVVVHPACGSGGNACLNYNLVTIEGVLANPHPELPEVVRLGWLITQLNSDLPRYGENIHPDRLPHVAGFALLPPALHAAEDVELARYSPELVATAIQAWGLAMPAGVDATTLVIDWWATYFDARPAWSVALTALDRMFE